MILGGSRGQGLWTSFPGLAPLVLRVVASLAWDLLWQVALAEGTADSGIFWCDCLHRGMWRQWCVWLGLCVMGDFRL